MNYDDEHPDVLTDLRHGEWWRIDADAVDFRHRLLCGSATDSWEGDEQLDLYYRDDPAKGRIWAIWRFAPELPGGRIRVYTIYGGRPGPELLRQLAAARVDRCNFTAQREAHEAAVARDAERRALEVESELRDHLRWLATSRHSPISRSH